MRAHDVDVFGGLGFKRSIRVACDRRGRRLRRIAVPKNTVLHVSGDTYDFGDMAAGRTSVYGNGTRLP